MLVEIIGETSIVWHKEGFKPIIYFEEISSQIEKVQEDVYLMHDYAIPEFWSNSYNYVTFFALWDVLLHLKTFLNLTKCNDILGIISR